MMNARPRRRALRGLAFFLLGLIAGASLATWRLGRAVDRLTLENAMLMDEVERLAGELAAREQILTQQRRFPVRSVEVEVANLAEGHVRLHLEGEALELLNHLVGEEVDELNPALIEKALSRTLRVDKQEYTVWPTLIILGSRVFVRLEAKEGQVDVSY